MRRCFLHIGTHKTGSTAIQVQLNNHRRQLARRGFLYPKTGIPAPLAGHHNIAWQLRGDRRFRPELGTVDDLFVEIGKSDHDVILSSEDFECTADNLGSFVGKLERYGFDVAFIIYFRDQISYCRTLYLGLARHQRYDRTFSEFLAELIGHRLVRWQDWVFTFDYRVLLDHLASAATIIARPYCRETSVIGDFASLLGLSLSDVTMDPDFRINMEEPVSQSLAAFYRNRTGRDIRRKCAATMQAIAGAFDGVDIDLGLAAKQRLIAALESSNRWMDERYGMPMLAGMARAMAAPDSSPNSGLDLEAVFSLVTVKLIDEMSQSELRRKWWVFGRGWR